MDPNTPDTHPAPLAVVIISRLIAGIAAVIVCYILYRIVQSYYDMTRHRGRSGAKGYARVSDEEVFGDEDDSYRDSISIGSPGPTIVDQSLLNRPLPDRPLPDKPLPSLPEGG
jgi:hypothetical protein